MPLKINFAWTVAGNAATALSHLLMMMVLVRFGGTEAVGLMVLAFAVCAPVNTLTNLGLRVVLITDVRREHPFRDYAALRWIASFAGAVAIVAMAALSGQAGGSLAVVAAVSVGKLFEAVSDIYHGLFQQHERMDWISRSYALRGFLTVTFMSIALVATRGSVVAAATAYAVATLVALAFYDHVMRRRLTATEPSGSSGNDVSNWFKLAQLAWLSAPQGVVMTMNSLITNLPKYSVGHYLGAAAVGVFGPVAYLAGGGLVLVTAMGHTLSPRMAKCYSAGNSRAFVRLLGVFAAFVVAVGFAGIGTMAVAGRPIIGVIYGEAMVNEAPLAVWLAVAAMAIYLTGPAGRALDCMRRFRSHMAIRLCSVGLLLAILPTFVTRQGMPGAAMAMAIAALSSVGLSLAIVAFQLRKSAIDLRSSSP